MHQSPNGPLRWHYSDSANIHRHTSRDPDLSKIYQTVQLGTNLSERPLYSAFHTKRYELSVENGCLLWGSQVVVPHTLRQQVLRELHQFYPGMVKMKALAQNYMWWPGMYTDMEEKVNNCYTWQSSRTPPAKAPLHLWKWLRELWHKIHMDYANYNGRNLLIVTNAHSKWIEVYLTRATNSNTTNEKLSCCFAMYGLPNPVSDNGPWCLTSLEFVEFTRKNAIKPKLVSLYH